VFPLFPLFPLLLAAAVSAASRCRDQRKRALVWLVIVARSNAQIAKAFSVVFGRTRYGSRCYALVVRQQRRLGTFGNSVRRDSFLRLRQCCYNELLS